MIAALYIRVSTRDQNLHGYSLSAQEDLLRSYAAQHDMTVFDLYADRGKSANKALSKRTELNRMLHDAELKKFDCILFKDITRWSRNSAQYYAVQDRLDKAGVYWLAVEQPYLETKTPTGRFQVTVMLGTAQLESENTSQRIKFVMANRIANGGAISGTHDLPLGYMTVNTEQGKRVVKDPSVQSAVMDMFDYYRRTQNQLATIRYMKDQYGITIWQASFSKILSNTMYYGEYRGNPDYCEPYLSKAEWLDLKRRTTLYRTQKHNSEYLFRGLLRCPVCGRNMVGRTKSYIYYVCPYHLSYHACEYSVWHRQDRIESFLLERIKPELDAYREKPQMKLPKKDKREKQQKSLQAKLERLKNLYIDGDLSKDEYTKKRDAVRAELGKLESAQSELDYEKLNAILNSGWRNLYDRIDPEDRAHFWRTILHHIEVLPDGTYKPWFNG